jgi:hypothetical protein
MADEPIEAWTNHEREFHVHHDRFFKRSFRPEEYRICRQNQPYVPSMGFERLKNEAACLEFVRSNTAIPVLAILEAYSQDGSFALVTERLFGVNMCKLPPDDQAIVMKEVETHLHTLQALGRIGRGALRGLFALRNGQLSTFRVIQLGRQGLGRTTASYFATATCRSQISLSIRKRSRLRASSTGSTPAPGRTTLRPHISATHDPRCPVQRRVPECPACGLSQPSV